MLDLIRRAEVEDDAAGASWQPTWPAGTPRNGAGRADHAARSVGLRLHVRDQRGVSRCRARHARGHVRVRVPRSAAGDLFQGNGAGVRSPAGSRSASGAIRNSRRQSRNWPWCWVRTGASPGTPWPTTFRPGTSNGRIRSTCRNRSSTMAAARWGRRSPAEEIPDPYQLEMTCTIRRDGKELFSGGVSTAAAAPADRDADGVPGRAPTTCRAERWC